MMSVEEAIKTLDRDDDDMHYGLFCFADFEAIKVLKRAVKNQPKWIPITERPMTEEEKEYYQVKDDELAWMYDCPLPDNGEDVLVSTKWGISMTPFFNDDGCYFECYEDKGDVLAWMPLPKRYEEGKYNGE